jgi:hypothetical protein
MILQALVKYNFIYKSRKRYSMISIFPLIFYFTILNIKENMRAISLIQVRDGSYVKTYQMDKKEFDSLSKDAEEYLIEWNTDIYILKNKNVIIHSTEGGFKEGVYCWYPSFEDLKKLRDFPMQKAWRHYFEGYNPYREKFPEKTRELVELLLSDLMLNKDSFSFNNNLILEVDRAILSTEDPQIFMITHLIQLSALVGEIFIAQNNAEWYMERDADGETWVPKILVTKSKEKIGTIGFVHWLYESIMYYEGNPDVVESCYQSLNDFNRLGLLTDERR